MDRQSLRPLFFRAAALFLALWCLMAGALTYLNDQYHQKIIRSSIEHAVLLAASRSDSADGWGDRWLSNFTDDLAPYGGAVTLRLYDGQGEETARSQHHAPQRSPGHRQLCAAFRPRPHGGGAASAGPPTAGRTRLHRLLFLELV